MNTKLLGQLFLTFAKVGVMTFGGGMAMLPILQREGVEDKATCDAVLAAGCDFIQGFYFSRVLPGREAESFLRSLAARDREEG